MIFAWASNKRVKLAKRGLSLGGWPALARRGRAIVTESRFAAYARCSADTASARHERVSNPGMTARTPALNGVGIGVVGLPEVAAQRSSWQGLRWPKCAVRGFVVSRWWSELYSGYGLRCGSGGR